MIANIRRRGVTKSILLVGSPQLWKYYKGVVELKRLRTADLNQNQSTWVTGHQLTQEHCIKFLLALIRLFHYDSTKYFY